jgi:hypothetical protein
MLSALCVATLCVFSAASATPAASPRDEGVCVSARSTPARHAYFPPEGTPAEVGAWFAANTPAVPPKPQVPDRERELASWTASTFVQRRRAGEVTCEEYTRALVNRSTHYRSMNVFMYHDNDPEWTQRVVDAARVRAVEACVVLVLRRLAPQAHTTRLSPQHPPTVVCDRTCPRNRPACAYRHLCCPSSRTV